MTQHTRATKRGEKILKRYIAKHDRCVDFEEAACDLIADVMHAVTRDSGPDATDRACDNARMNYEAEMVDE